MISVPADKTSKRYYSYYYDGDLRRTSQGTTEDVRFDITTIDANVMVRLIDMAKTELVEDPDLGSTRSSGRRREFTNGAWFSVYASNELHGVRLLHRGQDREDHHEDRQPVASG